MAGNPRRRQKAAAQAEGIPDAVTQGGATRARAPERPRGRAGAGAYMGTGTRNQADLAAASALADLAQVLRPGVVVRIERTRPTWAAGYIEELALQSGNLSELYDSLSENWGGKTYQISVLLPNGAPAFVSRIDIAGPPLWEGDPIDRAEWNGEPGKRERERRDAVAAIPAARTRNAEATPFGDMLGLFKMLLEQQEKSNDRQLQAVQQMSQTSAAQNQDLISAIVESRRPNNTPSLVAQLHELEASKKALDRMGRVFGAAEGSAAAESGMGNVINEAMKDVFKEGIANEMFRRGRPNVGTAQAAPKVQQNRPTHVRPVRTPGAIPNAHTGQRRPA